MNSDPNPKPIVAYKYIQISSRIDNYHLFSSPINDYSWKPGWNKIDNSPLSAMENFGGWGNGFYTFKALPENLYIFMSIVKVEIAGQIMEHTGGYRSEYAKIVSIEDCQPHIGKSVIIELERYYGLEKSVAERKFEWPKITRQTRVIEIPSSHIISTYHIPISPDLPVSMGKIVSEPVIIPYNVLSVPLNQTYFNGRDNFQYGYNSDYDVLVYKRIDK